MPSSLIKEKICTEDIELSNDSSVVQERGTLTPFNAYKLPYKTGYTTGVALDERYTKVDSDARYAKVAGDDTVAFKVFGGINPNEAINVQQINDLMDSTIALKADVLELDNSVVYEPLTDYNPSTKRYVDQSILTRFENAVSGSFTSADGKTITVVGGLITGII